MSDDLQSVLQNAASKILRPLIKVLLRNGVACGTFEEIVRKVYVDEAFAMAKQQGNKTTVSAVSAQTGLSRKEVKRLNEVTLDAANGNSQRYNRAIRVISGWINDPRFASPEGVAHPLDMEGTEKSFATLVKSYSGDIPTRAMFDLLSQSGCVKQLNDKVYLVSHAYLPGNDPLDLINILATDSHELMESVIHNMSAEPSQRRFQRKVSTRSLAEAHVEAFQKYAARRSQALLEDLDNWLIEHESQGDDARYVSLGIYYYQHQAADAEKP